MKNTYSQVETLPPQNYIPITRGSRYFDLNGVIYVIVYSKQDLIKLMPIKKNAMIDVWEVEKTLEIK